MPIIRVDDFVRIEVLCNDWTNVLFIGKFLFALRAMVAEPDSLAKI